MPHKIITPDEINLERRLLKELELSFDELSQGTVESLKISLLEIDPFHAQRLDLLGLVLFEGVKKLVSCMEVPSLQTIIPVKDKNPLIASAIEMRGKLDSSPEHVDLLPDFIKIRNACKALHDGFHCKGKGYIAPEAEAHNAVHAIGQLAMVLTFLPQLRELSAIKLPKIEPKFDMQKFLAEQSELRFPWA